VERLERHVLAPHTHHRRPTRRRKGGAVYLASDDAALVTATELLIDGGYVAFKGRIDADDRPAMI
jgi:hypothetical protein